MTRTESSTRLYRLAGLLAVLGVGTWATVGVFASAGCGGCPWTSASAVTVTPSVTPGGTDTSCLVLSLADTSGEPPSTGCVNPVLVGSNDCLGHGLLLPADYNPHGMGMSIPSGDSPSFHWEIDLARATHSGDSYSFSVPAELGGEAITIVFRLQ